MNYNFQKNTSYDQKYQRSVYQPQAIFKKDIQESPQLKKYKPKQNTTAESYLSKDIAFPGQEHDQNKIQQAQEILNKNISHLSKECFMKLKQDLTKDKDPQTIKTLLDFKKHQNIDQLVRNCMVLYDESNYTNMINRTSNSPFKENKRESSKSLQGKSYKNQDFMRSQYSQKSNFNDLKKIPQIDLKPQRKTVEIQQQLTSQNMRSSDSNYRDFYRNSRQDIHEIREILCIKVPGQSGFQDFSTVLRIINQIVNEKDKINRYEFSQLMHQLYPEIQKVQKFSKEGQILIDDSLNCLFNSFDIDRTEYLTYKKLCAGLDILCEYNYTKNPQKNKKKSKENVINQDEKIVPKLNQDFKSNNDDKSRIKEQPVEVAVKRESKAQRDQRTSKSGASIMQKQNELRAEAAKKQKEAAEAKKKNDLANDNKKNESIQVEKQPEAEINKFVQTKQELNHIFETEEFYKTVSKVLDLSTESCMRKINATKASKAFKAFIQKNNNANLNKNEFIDFMISMMKNYEFCDSKAEEEVLKLGFDDAFEAFDYDKSGKLDSEEIANCLALMCGGTINDKIYSAFNLFDVNNSMTLSFDELSKFVKCVFQVFYQIKPKDSLGVWQDVSLQKLTLATVEKCFSDNNVVKGSGEINYTQFMQWISGQSILDQETMEAIESCQKPIKKSDFHNRQFNNTKDFIEQFMKEQEFVDVVKLIQDESLLKNVRLFVIMIEFQQYKKTNCISIDQLKKSFQKVVQEETLKCTGKNLTQNNILKIDQICKKLIKIFDSNKNGKLEFTELISAFCILCKGSIEQKLKYLMLAYSENQKDEKSASIKIQNLKKFFECILKLGLQSSSEIILDYPIIKMADAISNKCMQFCGLSDKKSGMLQLDDICRFIESANVMNVLSVAEEDQDQTLFEE